MNTYIISDIEWDKEIDGEIQNVDLPETVEVEADDPDAAIDAASDIYGFCIHNAQVQVRE
jgi:hypothetical protein